MYKKWNSANIKLKNATVGADEDINRPVQGSQFIFPTFDRLHYSEQLTFNLNLYYWG